MNMPENPSPEQIKALQEKVKNMSPEELKEFQKKQCIFCKIISGEVSSRKVYEDEKCLAILDINPANPGHILLMPKEHFPLMPLMSEELIGHLFLVAKELSRVVLTAVGADGASIFVANGSAAGQRAQHFMIHVIPRKTGDEIKLDIPVKEHPKKEIDKAIEKIQERINIVFKEKKKVIRKGAEEKEKKSKEEKAEEKEKEAEDKEEKKEDKKEEKKESKKEKETKSKEKEKSKKKKGKKKKSKKSKNQKKSKDEEEDESGVSLDDIAKLVG